MSNSVFMQTTAILSGAQQGVADNGVAQQLRYVLRMRGGRFRERRVVACLTCATRCCEKAYNKEEQQLLFI